MKTRRLKYIMHFMYRAFVAMCIIYYLHDLCYRIFRYIYCHERYEARKAQKAKN